MRPFTFLAPALTLLLRTVAASDVVELLPDTFDDIVLKSGKPALVEFFAPWCGHCKNLAPVYEELATAFAKDNAKVTIAKVDADAHKALGKRFGVQGFPTLKWFDGKSDKPEEYSSGRDLESLTAFVVDKTGLKAKAAKKAVSNVVVLTDKTFGENIGGEKHALVAFTAPWCGHCKNLAPTWEKLADTYTSEPNITIGKVDAEADNSKVVATAQGIKSYPTIKYFPAGASEPSDYTGGRSEADFVSFLNDKAGTHRVPGGGLDSYAGTVAALDELVQAYVAAPGAEALAAVSKAAADAQEGAAGYYAKVAAKMGADETFAERELARLRKILEKGGVAGEKLDGLTRRRNVLERFQKKVEDVVNRVKEEL